MCGANAALGLPWGLPKLLSSLSSRSRVCIYLSAKKWTLSCTSFLPLCISECYVCSVCGLHLARMQHSSYTSCVCARSAVCMAMNGSPQGGRRLSDGRWVLHLCKVQLLYLPYITRWAAGGCEISVRCVGKNGKPYLYMPLRRLHILHCFLHCHMLGRDRALSPRGRI